MSTRQIKRKWEERLKDIEDLASSYKRRPLCLRYKPQLSKPWQPSSVWKLFHRQSEAFNFTKTCKEDVHVFALERSAESKQRFYLVTTYPEFWFYYRNNKTNLMHCYEVIRENAVCKLYFDLEFCKPINPEADGKQMVAELIKFVCEKLDQVHGIKCSAEDVLNLDSSTEEKFSCHLIFQLCHAAFKNNIHIGKFLRMILQPDVLLSKTKDATIPEKQGISVSHCCKTIPTFPAFPENQIVTKDDSLDWQLNSNKAPQVRTSQGKKHPDLSFLIVNGKHGEEQLFVDLGVYTKNRNFRLYKSSKAGKFAILNIAEDNKFVPGLVKNSSMEEQYFFSSLICNVRYSEHLKILSCENPEETKGISLGFDHSISESCLDSIEGYNYSPYPEIDKFVLSLVNKDNIQGGIRRWSYFSLEQLLVYDISKYRWCRNIGRAHKSNNIMILVDLKNENWYQKCHDPVCRAENFKSERFPLPAEVCLPFLFKEDEEYAYVMDENGNIEESRRCHDASDLSGSKDTSYKESSSVEWDEETDLLLMEAVEDMELIEAVNIIDPEKLNCI